jgi:hypothetical protein
MVGIDNAVTNIKHATRPRGITGRTTSKDATSAYKHQSRQPDLSHT